MVMPTKDFELPVRVAKASFVGAEFFIDRAALSDRCPTSEDIGGGRLTVDSDARSFGAKDLIFVV